MMEENPFIEKRLYPRFPVTLPVACCFCESSSQFTAQTHDISVEGIGLISTEELQAGSQIEISLCMSDNGEEIIRRGTVVWSIKVAGSKYCRAGIKLTDGHLRPIPLVLRTICNQGSY